MPAENQEGRHFFINSIAIAHEPDYLEDVDSIFSACLYSKAAIIQSPDEIPAYTPYLHPDVVQRIAATLGLGFISRKETGNNVCFINSEEVRLEFRTSFAAIDLLDYSYAVLHGPAYRKQYRECLKIDLPQVPYPKDTITFWHFVQLGRTLRSIHLLESPVIDRCITQYPINGDNSVLNVKYEDCKVYINDTQYFAHVPAVAWQFYIAGYQPAQKWLQDRQNVKLSFEDILRYQRIIVALTETDGLMREIDKAILE